MCSGIIAPKFIKMINSHDTICILHFASAYQFEINHIIRWEGKFSDFTKTFGVPHFFHDFSSKWRLETFPDLFKRTKPCIIVFFLLWLLVSPVTHPFSLPGCLLPPVNQPVSPRPPPSSPPSWSSWTARPAASVSPVRTLRWAAGGRCSRRPRRAAAPRPHRAASLRSDGPQPLTRAPNTELQPAFQNKTRLPLLATVSERATDDDALILKSAHQEVV